MKKFIYTSMIVASLIAVQNCSDAYITYTPNSNIKFNYISCDYDKLIAYSNIPADNIFTSPEIGETVYDIDTEMSIAKIIDDDFNLELDLDANAKKQLKPKVNVIQGYKIDSSPRCVEKVMKPHLKKYKVQEELIGDEIENIDIDYVTDIKEVVKQQKQERIAKAQKEKAERIASNANKQEGKGFFGLFKRKSSQELIADSGVEKVTPSSYDNVIKKVEKTSYVSPEMLASNQQPNNDLSSLFDADRTTEVKTISASSKTIESAERRDRKEAERITRENLKLAKPTKDKPVKVAKVSEPKPEKIKPVKTEKIAKAEPKVEKIKSEKPVRVAKVEQPKITEVKPVNPVKQEVTAKPVEKVANNTKTTPLVNNSDIIPSFDRIKNAKYDKHTKVAQTSAKTKSVKPANLKTTPKQETIASATPAINTSVFTTAAMTSALGKEQSNKFESIPTEKQITNKIGTITAPEPLKEVKVAKAEPKPEKIKPAKSEKIAKAEPKAEKVKPAKPVKIAKVEQPKIEKVKPVKPVKVAKVEPAVTEIKPVNVNTKPQQTYTQQLPKIPIKHIDEPAVAYTPVNTVAQVQQPVYKPQEQVKTTPVQTTKEQSVVQSRPFTPVKVEQKALANVPAQVEQPAKPAVQIIQSAQPAVKQTPVVEQKQEYIKPVQESKKPIIAEKKPAKTQPAPIAQTQPVVLKQIPVQDTYQAYQPVSNMQMPIKASAPQEMPVYSAFETMQNRLPITRKPFDTDDM